MQESGDEAGTEGDRLGRPGDGRGLGPGGRGPHERRRITSTSRLGRPASASRPSGLIRGTRDWLPADFARLAEIESTLVDRFARSGYRPIRIPVLEHTELHERKSGAGIVSKLYELADGHQARVCLRPELTAGVVRAYIEAEQAPASPWRVCVSGPVFRYEAMRPGFAREFHQVGRRDRSAPGGPEADGEAGSGWRGRRSTSSGSPARRCGSATSA